MPEDTVTITVKEYEELRRAAAELGIVKASSDGNSWTTYRDQLPVYWNERSYL